MRKRSGSVAAVVLAAFLLSAPSASSADYLIQPGDVLHIDVTGVSGMQHTVPVGLDGTIIIPLAGPVLVIGKNIHEITELLQTRLASKTLRQASPSGEDYLVIIDPQQILISVAEYRPVYLTGDVASPGEHQYRPGLTVRQAVSLAGGYDDGNPLQPDMFLQTADFRAELATLWTQFTRESMRVTRIRSELADADAPPFFQVDEAPLPRETLDDLARLETELFDANRVNRTKERAFLEGEIENSLIQLTTVKEQQEQEREGLEADTAELQRLIEMEQRGITTSSRVSESRRSLLMSSTRYLQATAQIAQFGREEASLRRRLEQQEDDRRTVLLDELQQAVVLAASTAEQIAAVSDKLRYVRAVGKPLDRGPAEPPTITVIRNGDVGPETIRADADMPLMPGDVVEISLPPAPVSFDSLLQN